MEEATYLDFERIHHIDPVAFRSREAYPWINPEQFLTDTGYQRLLETLPDISFFEPRFGVKRAHSQQSHDRFTLEYDDNLDVARPWKEFVAELRGKDYRALLHRLIGVRSFELSFHWHYTPSGCSVAPHCDAKRKLGSHIFYFNTFQDWDPTWGGETLIFDDGGRFDRKSAPGFNDFERVITSQVLGNRSLLFARKEHSWHGVREIHCPENHMRKVFIVVIDRFTPIDRLRRFFAGPGKGY